jgi:hypothetical protein
LTGSIPVVTAVPTPAETQRVLLIGHSHVAVLLNGLKACVNRGDSEALGNFEFASVFVDGGVIRVTHSERDKHARRVTGSWADVMPALLDNAGIAIMVLGGNEIPMSALIATGSEFDIVLGDTPADDRPPSVEVIPCSAVAMHFRKALFCAEHIEFVEHCQRSGTRTALLGPPPQLPAEAVRERLPRELFFQDKLEELGLRPTDVRLVPDAVRNRLWRLEIGIYRSFAAEHGFPSSLLHNSQWTRTVCWRVPFGVGMSGTRTPSSGCNTSGGSSSGHPGGHHDPASLQKRSTAIVLVSLRRSRA